MLHLQKNKNEPLIRIGHLKKSFGDVTPVKDVSCDIYQRDVISIIGPSGTGKSTLLNLINHLETADSGTILFEGQDTCAKDYQINRMREQIGMVFQSFNLFSHLTIIENLMLAQTELLKRSREEDGGTVDLDVTYPGEDRDPLEEGEGLSLTLTRHACSMLQWEYEGGICRIKGRLAQT